MIKDGSKRLFELFGEINDSFILEAEPKKITRSRPLIKALGIGAACAAAAALVWQSAGFVKQQNLPTTEPNSSYIDYDNLPFRYEPTELTRIGVELEIGGMGFEGMFAYDAEELKSSDQPREDMYFAELPVFSGSNRYMVFEKEYVITEMERIASALGEELTDIYYDTLQEEVFPPEDRELIKGKSTIVKAKAGEAELESYGSSVTIRLKGEDLADGHLLSYDDVDALADSYSYLLEKYSELIGFDSYTVSTTCGELDVYGNKIAARAFAYLNTGNEFNDFIYRNFAAVTFYTPIDIEGNPCDELRITVPIRLSNMICSGFYPTITPEEARNKLLSGDYVTTVPDEYLPNGMEAERVKCLELVYRETEMREYYLPYYRFIVEIDDIGSPKPFKEFGVYYVPAIQAEYIADVDTQTRFN